MTRRVFLSFSSVNTLFYKIITLGLVVDCSNMYYNYYVWKMSDTKKENFYIEREEPCDDNDNIPDNMNGQPYYSFNDDKFGIQGTYNVFWDLL
jgi:hypothetical protein